MTAWMFPSAKNVRNLEAVAFATPVVTDSWTAYYREQYSNRLLMRQLALAYSE